MSIKKNFFAPLATGQGATRRAAMLLAGSPTPPNDVPDYDDWLD